MTRAAAALLIAIAPLMPACGKREAARSSDAPGTALSLFDAARREPLSEAEIDRIVDVARAPGGRARLYDAVAALRSATRPRALATTRLDGDARAEVDVEAELSGGGRASYAVELAKGPDGSWRITAFWGPGIGWPERAPPTSEGLSVSPPPR